MSDVVLDKISRTRSPKSHKVACRIIQARPVVEGALKGYGHHHFIALRLGLLILRLGPHLAPTTFRTFEH